MSTPEPPALSPLDRLHMWLGLISIGSMIAMPISVTPSFLAMIGDFGGDLPLLTSLVFSAWFPPMLALPAAGLLIGSRLVQGESTPRLRRRLLFGAAALGLAGVFLCVMGYSMPLMSTGQSVAAE